MGKSPKILKEASDKNVREAGYYKNDELPKIDDNFVKIWKNNRTLNEFRRENLNECVACSYLFAGSVKSQDPYGLQAYIEYCKSKIL